MARPWIILGVPARFHCACTSSGEGPTQRPDQRPAASVKRQKAVVSMVGFGDIVGVKSGTVWSSFYGTHGLWRLGSVGSRRAPCLYLTSNDICKQLCGRKRSGVCPFPFPFSALSRCLSRLSPHFRRGPICLASRLFSSRAPVQAPARAPSLR